MMQKETTKEENQKTETATEHNNSKMCVERDYLIKFHEFIAGDYMARNWIAFNIDK